MRKTAIFFLVFLLVLSAPFSYCATDEGYGEANENLGQHTDSFENEDYVSVLSDVIVNTTLDCVELNYTSPSEAIYNLTSLREHDLWTNQADTSFSIVNNDELRMISTVSGYGQGYIFYIMNSDWIHDKYIRFRWYPSCNDGLVGHQNQFFEIYDGTYDRSNDVDFPVGAWPPLKGNGQLYSYKNTDGLNNWYTKDFLIDTSGGSENNVTVQFRIQDGWTGTTIGIYLDWIEINEGAGGTDNILTIDFSNSSPITMERTGTRGDYGFALNPELPYQTGGYETDGYFITEDYLNYTQGESLNLLTNSSLPENTGITVEFSSDNVTWFDNHGNSGASTIRANFTALDLRDLNYSDIFMRYNLTGLGASTPRIYQSRLVTTNARARVVESDAPWIALAIILSIIAFLLAWGINE